MAHDLYLCCVSRIFFYIVDVRQQQGFIHACQLGQITMLHISLHYLGHSPDKAIKVKQPHKFFMCKIRYRSCVELFQCLLLTHGFEKLIKTERIQKLILYTPHRKRNRSIKNSFEQRTGSYYIISRIFFVKIA